MKNTYKIFNGVKYPFNTAKEQEIYFRTRAINILDRLNSGEKVSRWDVMLSRDTIRTLVFEGSKYQHLSNDVEDLIESAKESL